MWRERVSKSANREDVRPAAAGVKGAVEEKERLPAPRVVLERLLRVRAGPNAARGKSR